MLLQRVARSLCLSAGVLLASATCVAAQEQPASATSATIPDTPAGTTLAAWLVTFNSKDDSVLKTFLAQYQPLAVVDNQRSLRDQLAGVQLLRVTKSSPSHIEFLLSANNGMTLRGKLDVDDKGHIPVAEMLLRSIPPEVAASASANDVMLDKPLRHKVIDEVLATLDDRYVFPDLATKMKASIHRREAQGEYDAITDSDAFATQLTNDLQSVSHDKHLAVYFYPYPPPPEFGDVEWREPSADERDDMLRRNCDFERVEVLPSNVGYIKFNGFEDPDVCGATVAAAMAFVANVDALIFDLRDNGGGDPQTVQLLESYLFAEPTHLNDLVERKGNKTTQYWTLPYLPGKRIVGKPVYLLTSVRTFSGAEEFAYDLKNLKRATIVGEQTGGGAHPSFGHQVAKYFRVVVPFARPINPISGTDWEGVGVVPDVKVPVADALTKAQSLAGDELAKSHRPDKPAQQP